MRGIEPLIAGERIGLRLHRKQGAGGVAAEAGRGDATFAVGPAAEEL